MDPTIVGGDHDGFQIRYVKVSAKPFKRGKETASQMGDYLKACGVTASTDGSPQSLANLVETTSGSVLTVDLDWRAFNKNTGKQVEGMENFPKDAAGEPLPWFEDDDDVDENGKARRVRANITVDRYISA